MGDALFDSSTLPLLQKVAAFTERRQSVLAGNIANASTPNYQTRDLPVAEFQQALRDAISQRQSPAKGVGVGSNWSFEKAQSAQSVAEALPARLLQAVPQERQLNFQDGNNRNIERDVMEMTKNSLMQTMAIELITSQMNRLQAAISERA